MNEYDNTSLNAGFSGMQMQRLYHLGSGAVEQTYPNYPAGQPQAPPPEQEYPWVYQKPSHPAPPQGTTGNPTGYPPGGYPGMLVPPQTGGSMVNNGMGPSPYHNAYPGMPPHGQDSRNASQQPQQEEAPPHGYAGAYPSGLENSALPPHFTDPFSGPMPPSIATYPPQQPTPPPPIPAPGYPPASALPYHLTPHYAAASPDLASYYAALGRTGPAAASQPLPAPPAHVFGSGGYSAETLSAALSAHTQLSTEAQRIKTQEQQDREQLEKIIRLRRELELEEEREQEKEREKQTWGCPQCTFRNPLVVTQCDMCGTPHPNAPRPQPTASSASGVVAPWECSRCFTRNTRGGQCSVCGELSSVRAAAAPSYVMPTPRSHPPPPPASPHIPPNCMWRCSVCNKVNNPSRSNCEACNGYKRNGIPVMDGPPVDLRPPVAALAPGMGVGELKPTVWNCSVCTLENSVANAVCSACQSGQRPCHLAPPKEPKAHRHHKSREEKRRTEHGSERTESSTEKWSCSVCTFVNSAAHSRCDMCGTEWENKPKEKDQNKAEEHSDEEEVMWQEDNTAKNCNRCNSEFGLLRRRHHCRACGFVFCATCSPFHMALKKDTEPVRLCVACHEARQTKD